MIVTPIVAPIWRPNWVSAVAEPMRDRGTAFWTETTNTCIIDPIPIPALHSETVELGYLGGHTLAELLDAERRATADALRQAGRPSMTIELERVDAHALGALFMLFQIATVYAGSLFGVDPLDQPGVELGKQLTYGLLGRPGFSAPAFGNVDPRWRV